MDSLEISFDFFPGSEGFDRACLESVARESTWTVVTIDNTRFEAAEKWNERGRGEDLIDFSRGVPISGKDGIGSGNFERADATCRHESSSCAVKFPGQP